MIPLLPPAGTYQPNRRWGIRMSGSGEWLEHLLRQHTAQHGAPDQPYTLIEVGSAGCVSLRAFADILAECGKTKWRAVGFDLTLDKAWSVNMNEVRQSFNGLPWQVWTDDLYALMKDVRGMALVLLNGPRAYLGAEPTAEGLGFPHPIDLAFIDASHGKSCAHDFCAIESKVARGGLVAFHDYGEPEQGTDWQDHDREFISVRSYVHRLGLNAPSPKGVLRKGWRFVGEIKGSRHWSGDGNSVAVVQRTEEPLQSQPELSVD